MEKTKSKISKSESITRCGWCVGDELYESYHDEEWGVATYDAQELFERLILEGMQAGLSWITVLRKRDEMRTAFYDFDMQKLAECKEPDILKWLDNAGLIRHRGKLTAMIGNAQLALAQESFADYLWQFKPSKSKNYRDLSEVPSDTEASRLMSKTLKKDGFKFVGPTICYAFMQSVGMVNDHLVECWRHKACQI